MKATITSKFRIAEKNGQRTYFPGDVAEGASAAWALEAGFGEKMDEGGEAKAEPAPKNKARTAPKNKSA